jgi:hypothetical protein
MRKWTTILVCVILATILLVTSCNSSESTTTTKDDDIGVWSIDVEVAGENPTTFTNEDAKKIGPKEITAAVKDKDTTLEAKKYTGILIGDFLSHIGIEEYSVISIEGSAGAPVELDSSRIDANGTGFAWMENGEKLDAASGPVMLVNNGRGPNWWIKKVSKITIIK